MAAPRATQLLALRRVTAITKRHLHMTGPATFSSPLLSSTTERPAGAIPNASISLENTSTRRPSTSPFTSNGTADSSPVNKPVRHFNTSRALKAVNDTSTIDFAYLPDFDPDLVQAPLIRVPLMPENFSPKRDGVHAPEVGDEVSRHYSFQHCEVGGTLLMGIFPGCHASSDLVHVGR